MDGVGGVKTQRGRESFRQSKSCEIAARTAKTSQGEQREILSGRESPKENAKGEGKCKGVVSRFMSQNIAELRQGRPKRRKERKWTSKSRMNRRAAAGIPSMTPSGGRYCIITALTRQAAPATTL
jgi:hypothetical protein